MVNKELLITSMMMAEGLCKTSQEMRERFDRIWLVVNLMSMDEMDKTFKELSIVDEEPEEEAPVQEEQEKSDESSESIQNEMIEKRFDSEYFSEKSKAWALKNPERYKETQRKYREREKTKPKVFCEDCQREFERSYLRTHVKKNVHIKNAKNRKMKQMEQNVLDVERINSGIDNGEWDDVDLNQSMIKDI